MYQPGDYVCVSIHSSFFSSRWFTDNAIRLFTHSMFCHAFIVANEHGAIIEANAAQGIHVAHISKYDGMQMLGSKDILTIAQRKGIVTTAQSFVGNTAYGFLDIVDVGLYSLGFQPTWLTNIVQDETHRMICSQLVAQCGRDNGLPQWMCGKEYASLVTPADLANYALNP